MASIPRFGDFQVHIYQIELHNQQDDLWRNLATLNHHQEHL